MKTAYGKVTIGTSTLTMTFDAEGLDYALDILNESDMASVVDPEDTLIVKLLGPIQSVTSNSRNPKGLKHILDFDDSSKLLPLVIDTLAYLSSEIALPLADEVKEGGAGDLPAKTRNQMEAFLATSQLANIFTLARKHQVDIEFGLL